MLNYGYRFSSLVLFGLLTGAAAGDENALLIQSRQLSADYATELQSALQAAIADGGPADAITVCADTAPAVASRLSRQSGAKVRRTSLRFRNPGNAPDAWETQALQALEMSGDGELYDPDAPGGPRYLKAIRTGPVCLACHGQALADPVKERLGAAYPHDRATGFEVGDLRGAFSVTWPAANATDSGRP